jgi:hypothetical protein
MAKQFLRCCFLFIHKGNLNVFAYPLKAVPLKRISVIEIEYVAVGKRGD